MLKLIIYILAVFVTLSLANNVSAAGNEVWIEPGKSIGNIRIASSYKDVVQLLGPAQWIKGSNLFFSLKYHKTEISMENGASLKRALTNNDGNELNNFETATTTKIVTFSPFAKTRGGIKIGSSLKEVLDVFGGASPIFSASGEKPTALFCSNIYIYKYPEDNPITFLEDSFSGHVLFLSYNSEGISFYFRINDKSLSPIVIAIGVSSKGECKNLIDL